MFSFVSLHSDLRFFLEGSESCGKYSNEFWPIQLSLLVSNNFIAIYMLLLGDLSPV